MPEFRTARIGLHACQFPQLNQEVLTRMRGEVVTLYTHYDVKVFEQMYQLGQQQAEFEHQVLLIARHRVPYAEPYRYVQELAPKLKAIAPYCHQVELGFLTDGQWAEWPHTRTPSDPEQARHLATWFSQTYDLLRAEFPDLQMGFPAFNFWSALQYRHRADLRDTRLLDQWLDGCKDAIEKADWVGVSAAWDVGGGPDAWQSPAYGLTHVRYHEKFPAKIVHVLEGGNYSDGAGDPTDEGAIATQTVEWVKKAVEAPYLVGASLCLVDRYEPVEKDSRIFKQREAIRLLGESDSFKARGKLVIVRMSNPEGVARSLNPMTYQEFFDRLSLQGYKHRQNVEQGWGWYDKTNSDALIETNGLRYELLDSNTRIIVQALLFN